MTMHIQKYYNELSSKILLQDMAFAGRHCKILDSLKDIESLLGAY